VRLQKRNGLNNTANDNNLSKDDGQNDSLDNIMDNVVSIHQGEFLLKGAPQPANKHSENRNAS